MGGLPKIWENPQIIHLFIGFSIINHPFWDTPIFGNTHIYLTNATKTSSKTLGPGLTCLIYPPENENTYPTKRQKENHRLKNALLDDMLVPRRALITHQTCQVSVSYVGPGREPFCRPSNSSHLELSEVAKKPMFLKIL